MEVKWQKIKAVSHRQLRQEEFDDENKMQQHMAKRWALTSTSCPRCPPTCGHSATNKQTSGNASNKRLRVHGRVPEGEFAQDPISVHVLVAVEPVVEDEQFVD